MCPQICRGAGKGLFYSKVLSVHFTPTHQHPSGLHRCHGPSCSQCLARGGGLGTIYWLAGWLAAHLTGVTAMEARVHFLPLGQSACGAEV